MDITSISMNKSEARALYLDKRRNLSFQQIHQFNTQIFKRFQQLLTENPFSNFESVFCYLPIIKNNEPDIRSIIRYLISRENKVVSVPKMKNNGEFEVLPFTYPTTLQVNKYGIAEPLSGTPILAMPQLAVVPLLIADSKGNRVGYGGGFYDRFFQKNPNMFKLGTSFFEPINTITDINAYDVKLNALITPTNYYSFKQ